MNIPFYNPPRVTEREWLDRQWGACLYIFHTMRNPQLRQACFSRVGPGIDKEALLEAASSWSRSEYLLTRTALDLFEPGCVARHEHRPASIGECVEVLDKANLVRVRTALSIAAGEITAVAAVE